MVAVLAHETQAGASQQLEKLQSNPKCTMSAKLNTWKSAWWLCRQT